MLSRANKLLVILGPTVTGKTDLALFLAKKFKGELVSCDSRQVYTGLDIGTGKIPSQVQISNVKFHMSNILKRRKFWKINGIKIWMYDVVSPKVQYTVADYVTDATRVIEDIGQGGKLPIIVGGTGLYLKALLEGLPNLSIPVDQKLRSMLEKLSLKGLQNKLQKVSPKRWQKMNSSDRQNRRRLVRAIEIVILNPKGEGSSMVVEDSYTTLQNDILKIGLIAPREILYKKVDERVVTRIKQGMVGEAKKLHKAGLTFKRMKQLGLEYGVLVDYLNGKISTKDELIRMIQNKIHGYVRRQLTWFKKEKGVIWFDIVDEGYANKLENLVARWYDSRYVSEN